jgi:hypothetical protein
VSSAKVVGTFLPFINTESIECFIQDQAFSPLFHLAPPSPLPPLYRQQAVSLSQSSCVSSVELTDGRGGGRGAKSSYDDKKAWTSIHHSILSASIHLQFYLSYRIKLFITNVYFTVICKVVEGNMYEYIPFLSIQIKVEKARESRTLNCVKVGFLIAWIGVKRPHPLTPPSASAERMLEREHITARHNRTYLFFTV